MIKKIKFSNYNKHILIVDNDLQVNIIDINDLHLFFLIFSISIVLLIYFLLIFYNYFFRLLLSKLYI